MAKRTYSGNRKGMCNVSSDKGILRISIPSKFYGGKRKYLYCGLRDSRSNVHRVQDLADLMNGDIYRGEFDFSLVRYRQLITVNGIALRNQSNYSGNIPGVHETKLMAVWSRWIDHLAPPEETYNNKYRWVERYIQTQDPDWDDPDWTHAIDTSPVTFNAYISYVRRCVEWALEERIIKGQNPYKDLSRSTKGQRKVRKGFNAAEKRKILGEFKTPTHHDPEQCRRIAWFHLMVLFWFMTGLRVGEVTGLKWSDIQWEKRQIIIRRSQSRDYSNEGKGHRLKEKSTKTGRERILQMSEPVEGILRIAMDRPVGRNGLVFPVPNGTVVNMGNWRRRVWAPALRRAGVPYQPPKNVRHTLLTEAAQDPKIGVVGAAKIAGHTTTRTVQDNYIDVTGVAQLPSGDRSLD